ncbi:P-loop containing nucleoside triphosphate hydrolase protein [Schizophyllum commune Loenen D]|nr:P-loop containing nucleoside triphosphate hydrolase protein [Schizophyllum commune Loenen D]
MSLNDQGTTPANDNSSLLLNSPEWIESTLAKHFRVPALHPAQLECCRKIIDGNDLMLIAACGFGKTLVLLAGLVAARERNENAVGVFIAPTKAIVEQVASTAPASITSIAINSDTLRAAASRKTDLFKSLKDGKHARLAVMTPQMFTGARFRALLKCEKTRRLFKFVAIDEAHLVDEQGNVFQKPYLDIRPMRDVLPSAATWVLATGSATAARDSIIASQLGLLPKKYIRSRHSLDRPNILWDIRFTQFPTTTHQHLDLSFVIDPAMNSFTEIPPTIIFCKTFGTGYSVMRALDKLIPQHVPSRNEIIAMYGSIHDKEARARMPRDLVDPASPLKLLIATDSVAHGVDVLGILRVIIFDPTSSTLNILKQEGGRVRGTVPAPVIVLVPPWARIIPADQIRQKQQKEDAARRGKMDQDLLRFINASRTDGYQDVDDDVVCPRALDCKLNAEPFNPDICRCNKHSPDSTRSLDALANAQWNRSLNTAVKPKKLVSDRTYSSLANYPIMRHSLGDILHTWARRRYRDTSRTDATLHLPYGTEFPPCMLDGLPAKAHLCTTLARLKQVTDQLVKPAGWLHFSQHGEALLRVLQAAMTGFSRVIGERKVMVKSY